MACFRSRSTWTHSYVSHLLPLAFCFQKHKDMTMTNAGSSVTVDLNLLLSDERCLYITLRLKCLHDCTSDQSSEKKKAHDYSY